MSLRQTAFFYALPGVTSTVARTKDLRSPQYSLEFDGESLFRRLPAQDGF